MELKPQFPEVKGVFEAYDVSTGELVWRKGKNSSVLIAPARQAMLRQLFGYGKSYTTVPEGAPPHPIPKAFRKRQQPFCNIALGDGTESPDEWLDDLVHPLTEHGKTYDGKRRYDSGNYCKGEWQLYDGAEIARSDTTAQINLWFTFGSEDAVDQTVTEWGLFSVELNSEDIERCTRHYFNRNHLEISDQWYKTANIEVRMKVTITMVY